MPRSTSAVAVGGRETVDVEVIERDSTTAPLASLVSYLQEHLGTQTTAYVAGLKDAQMVAKWIGGTSKPRDMTARRLRYAYVLTRMIAETYDKRTADAWFFGSNSRLDDEAPAWILRNAKKLDDLRLLVPAAKAFARAPE